uniref:Tetraspanin 31 n=1 Tax=Anas zonorhyncha TaxID=75864 RepID=A0A8B9UKT8_9AVES
MLCAPPQLVGLLLVAVAAWGKGFGLVSSIHIIGGVIAVGVFLLLIAVVGLVGAVHPHQEGLFSSTWPLLSNKTKTELEESLDCCGLLNSTADPGAFRTFQAEFSACPAKCKALLGRDPRAPPCLTCGEKMLRHSDEALKILGGVGLFFSFTEVKMGLGGVLWGGSRHEG